MGVMKTINITRQVSLRMNIQSETKEKMMNKDLEILRETNNLYMHSILFYEIQVIVIFSKTKR